MPRPFAFAGVALLLSLSLSLGGCLGAKVLEVPDMREVEFKDLISAIRDKRIVFIGEFHDSRAHHAFQFNIIKGLNESGVRVALGLEMFRRESQQDLDRWSAKDMSIEKFTKVYYDNWKIPWPYYRDIFIYAREHGIPLVALNIPWKTIKKVVKEGFSSLSPDEAMGLTGVRCEVDRAYEEMILEAMGEHSGEGDVSFKNFCEAQLLWDKAMAKRIEEYLRENPGRNMVVIAGGAHSWRRGIPRNLGEDSLSYTVLLPELSDAIDRDSATKDDADYLWIDP